MTPIQGLELRNSMEGAFWGEQGSQCVQESDVVAIVFLLWTSSFL